jgi:tRNA modification GTPase
MTSPISPEGITGSLLWQQTLGATQRHRLLLQDCQCHLSAFLEQAVMTRRVDGSDFDIVVAAEALRGAAGCLANITGRGDAGDVEEVLDVVFERFCIGK